MFGSPTTHAVRQRTTSHTLDALEDRLVPAVTAVFNAGTLTGGAGADKFVTRLGDFFVDLNPAENDLVIVL